MDSNQLLALCDLMEKLSQEFISGVRAIATGAAQDPSTPSNINREEMTRLQVIKYLGISERTYIRKVKDGTLKPRKMPGGDRFYKCELLEAFNESIRRGRV